jgi:TIR domain
LSGEQVTDTVYEIDRLKGESPIQINPLFISYSRRDSGFVEALEPRFDHRRMRYWRDVHDATAGPLEEQIERAIRVNPTFLLVLSEHSVQSDWVEMEAEKARRLEKDLRQRGEPRHVLCPVALDAAWETAGWPERLMNQIKKYNILDFSSWEDEEFLEAMFGRLLKGLGIYYRQSD